MTALEAIPTNDIADVDVALYPPPDGPAQEQPGRSAGVHRAPSDPAGPAAHPGVIATTRRLAWALTGAPEALPPSALDQVLRERAQAARDAGLADAAAALEAAERYVARALHPEPVPVGHDREAPVGRQQLFAAAVRQVYRAYGLSGGARTGVLRAPAEPPDPAFIEQPAALIEDLHALRVWSGLDTTALVAVARRAGVPVNERRLLATLDGRRFPAPGVVEAVARGCGLSAQQSFGWLAARHRAARMFLSAREIGVRPPDRAQRAAAALDPQDAETQAQLTALLLELKARRGVTLGQIQSTASRAGHTVSWSRLWAVAARYTFPTPRTLQAFVIGCGVEQQQREGWLAARDRLATGRTRTRRAEHHPTHRPSAADLGRPGGPPDPRGAHTWAQFAAALNALVRWSGCDLATIAQRALDHAIPVTTDALHYTLAHRTLPAISTLNAFTTGCGLSSREQFYWRAVRARLSTLPQDTQLVPPQAIRVLRK